MRAAPVTGLAVAALAVLLAVVPVAGAASGPGSAPTGDRIQQALRDCVALGYRAGTRENRACAERLLGVQPAPADQPVNGQPPGGGDGGQPVTPQPRAPRPSGPVIADQGIVQGVAGDQIVLRALDGSSISVPFDVRTKFFVGDRPGTLADVVPGVVATVRHQNFGVAVDVHIAIAPKPKLRIDRGITESAGPTAIIIQLRNGRSRIIAIGGTTRVFAPNGRQVGAEALRSGLLVDVLYDPAGATPAQSVKIIRRV